MGSSYGEHQVADILDQLKALKQQVINGELSVVDYQAQADPMVKQAATLTGQISGRGSSAANAVNPIWQQFQNENFVGAQGGKWVTQMPFTRQEYAKLPDSVLPTQADADSGMFDPASVPFERYQKPAVNPGPGGTSGTPTTGPDGLPSVDTTLPTNVDLRTDRGQIAQQGQTNAGIAQDALNKQYEVNQQAVERLRSGTSGVGDIYGNEGQNQQAQLNALAEAQKNSRSQSLTDLAGILANRQMDLFNRSIPGLAEQANTKGILRSTGFGDMLSQKYTDLTADTQHQLALQGISDREAYLGAQQGALSAGLDWSGRKAVSEADRMGTLAGADASTLQGYGSGLGDVANIAIGANNAGLSRQFSLSDYLQQTQAAKDLANSMKPAPQTGLNSPGTKAAVQGTLGAANTAAKFSSKGQS